MFRVPVTYFFDFEHITDRMRPYVMTEFAAAGAKHLVLTDALIQQIIAKPGLEDELLREMSNAGLSFLDYLADPKVGSQEIPGVTGKFGLGVPSEAGQRLTEFCQENALVIANTLFQQHNRRLYTWTSPDGQYQNQIDYILHSQRWRSSIQSAKTRLGADCGSDHELLLPNSDLN